MIDKRFLYGLATVIALLIVAKIWGPKPIDWSPTLDPEDKIPYGTWVLQEELRSIFSEVIPLASNSWYELFDEDHPPAAVISLSQNFFSDSLDAVSLLNYVDSGGFAFISAAYFAGLLADSLKLATDNGGFFSLNLNLPLEKYDSAALNFVNPHWEPAQKYYYRSSHWYAHFTSYDTLNSEIVAVDHLDLPVLLKSGFGKGAFIFSSTPLVFSNYYMLQPPNHEFVSKALSLLPAAAIQRNIYHQGGQRESSTPLRFVVSQPALRWAYYLILSSLVLFVVFEAKRKQRVIPVHQPLTNTTVDFVKTIGRLYYEQGDHQDLAQKMILYFKEDLRVRYQIHTLQRDADFMEILSKKSTVEIEFIRELFRYMDFLADQDSISSDQLMKLHEMLKAFRQLAI